MGWLMHAIMDEVLDELADGDDTRTALYFTYFGKIIDWVGTGNTDSLPDELKAWLVQEQNIPAALTGLSEQLAEEQETRETVAMTP
jgi:hypothetical protein